MREFQPALRTLKAIFGFILWMGGTAWLGVRTIWQTCVLLSRLKAITAQVRLCPRAHPVSMYGLFDCACGGRLEGWAYMVCPLCRETTGYVACSICGLPVTNPLLI